MTPLSFVSSTRTITGSLSEGILLEHYRYPPGPPGSDSLHVHDDYQLGLSLDFPGEYVLKTGSFAVPAGTLSIIYPGEVHTARASDIYIRLSASSMPCDSAWTKENLGKFKQWMDDGMAP